MSHNLQIAKPIARLALLTFLLMGIHQSTWAEVEADDLPPVTLIAAKDLRSDSQQSHDARIPILLYFGSDYCTYCRYVEEEQLKPMLRNHVYDTKVMVRRVNMNDYGNITYIDGKTFSASELATFYRTSMTPTLIFIDADGHEIAPRLVGVSSRDFYGGDLDNSIDAALNKLRHSMSLLQQNLH